MAAPKIIFDLDKTLWNCYNSEGTEIWAKQLVPPLVFESDTVVCDRHGSCCVLQPGVTKMFSLICSERKATRIGFLSVGALEGVPLEEQPSVKILQKFNLYRHFNTEKILVFKTEKKDKYLKDMGGCMFVDDDDKHLQDAKKLENVIVVDRKSMKNWDEVTSYAGE